MALSKARNRDRMRLIRLHKLLEVKSVQPKDKELYKFGATPVEYDADGNLIPEYI